MKPHLSNVNYCQGLKYFSVCILCEFRGLTRHEYRSWDSRGGGIERITTEGGRGQTSAMEIGVKYWIPSMYRVQHMFCISTLCLGSRFFLGLFTLCGMSPDRKPLRINAQSGG